MSPSQALGQLQQAVGMCLACCPHGGMCTRPPAHAGPHQARDEDDVLTCQWEEAESVSRAEADALLAAGGHGWVAGITRFLEDQILAEGDDVP